MAKDYGTYTKVSERTGAEMERHPESASDVVALEFDGWRKKKTKSSPSNSTGSKSASSS